MFKYGKDQIFFPLKNITPPKMFSLAKIFIIAMIHTVLFVKNGLVNMLVNMKFNPLTQSETHCTWICLEQEHALIGNRN